MAYYLRFYEPLERNAYRWEADRPEVARRCAQLLSIAATGGSGGCALGNGESTQRVSIQCVCRRRSVAVVSIGVDKSTVSATMLAANSVHRTQQ
jgi:hypothetical protein